MRTLGIGRCSLLGELIDETEIRYFYRRRCGHVLAFVEKQSPVIHLEPCRSCPDYSSPTERVPWFSLVKIAVRPVMRWASLIGETRCSPALAPGARI